MPSIMKSIFKRPIITDLIAALFILLFIYAAASKLLDYEKFLVQLGKSPVLSPFASWTAWLVPSVEILISLLLVFERTRHMAMYACFTLMVIFSAYIIVILHFSSYIPCSCGGILEKMSWGQHFWFNIFFVALALLGVLIYSNKPKSIIAQ